jgi:hypothetical protein
LERVKNEAVVARLFRHLLRESEKNHEEIRAVAQAVRRWLPTAAARVQTRVWSCGILGWTRVALGQVFSENFGFPYQSTFHLLLHNHLHYHPRLAQYARSVRSAKSLTTQIIKKKSRWLPAAAARVQNQV